MVLFAYAKMDIIYKVISVFRYVVTGYYSFFLVMTETIKMAMDALQFAL